MNRFLVLLAGLLLVPSACAQTGALTMGIVQATATSHRIDLTWESSGDVDYYEVLVYENGQQIQQRNTTKRSESFFLDNGVTYVFTVTPFSDDGRRGNTSAPVAATPRLQNDLAYLAAGLVAVWVGVFGYAAFLARKEASIERKLERILQTRFQGRSP